MNDQDFRHWRLDYDIDHVCWLTLDRAGERNNSLSVEVLAELGEIVTGLEAEPPTGLVLQSGKPGSFIVGADVREFDGYTDPELARDSIHHVHQLLNRIEASLWNAQQVADYVDVLLDKIDESWYPSGQLLDRVQRMMALTVAASYANRAPVMAR